MADERSTPLFNVPDIKAQVGWRMNEEDMKNMRLLMADRRMTKVSSLIRELVEQAAEPVRQRMIRSAKRIAQEEEAEHGS